MGPPPRERLQQPSAAQARPHPREDSSPDSLASEQPAWAPGRKRSAPQGRGAPTGPQGRATPAASGDLRPVKAGRTEAQGLARTGTGLITDFSRALDDSLNRPEVRAGVPAWSLWWYGSLPLTSCTSLTSRSLSACAPARVAHRSCDDAR